MPEDLIIMGRKLGTYLDWDDCDDLSVIQYNGVELLPEVEATLGVSAEVCSIDSTLGEITFHFENDQGRSSSIDLIPILAALPKEPSHG